MNDLLTTLPDDPRPLTRNNLKLLANVAVDADLAYHEGPLVIDRRFYRGVLGLIARLDRAERKLADIDRIVNPA